MCVGVSMCPCMYVRMCVCVCVSVCVCLCVGKEVSVVMEYNRQVPFGGAVAAEAAKARNQTVEMRDMAFATVTIAEKDGSGQQRSSNVRLSPTLHLAVGCQTLYSVCYASLSCQFDYSGLLMVVPLAGETRL